jgi:hypothetical protein
MPKYQLVDFTEISIIKIFIQTGNLSFVQDNMPESFLSFSMQYPEL